MLSELAAQDGTVRGRVSSGGQAVPGAQISMVRPDGATVRRSVSQPDGAYEITVPAGTYDVLVTAFGYAEIRGDAITVGAGSTATRDFVLAIEPFSIRGASVTAGRRSQKALDAPASISVLDVIDLETHHAITALDHVEGVPGVATAFGISSFIGK